MKKQKSVSILFFLSVLLVLVPVPGLVCADWLKTNNPPDVDKAEQNDIGKPTCFIASAANMLAGAGYGDGNTVQERADDIYNEMRNDGNIYWGRGGWADVAMRGWLRTDNNKWKQTNPYKYVHLYGDPDCKRERDPWQNPNMPKFVGNELRNGHVARLSMYRPGVCGHAITAWGDDGDANLLTCNPNEVKVTDSDYSDATQAIQTYTYDDYNNPNPAGSDYGDGWYINYDYKNNHRYIDNVVTLSNMPNFVDLTSGASIGITRIVTGSYQIHQNNAGNATDLHYKVGADRRTYGYRTQLDWDTNDVPDITENNNPPTELTVDWDLSDNPVPNCNYVTITTQLNVDCAPTVGVLVNYSSLHFTYPGAGPDKPEFGWRMTTTLSPSPNDSNATGGYVVGAFELFEDVGGSPGPIIGAYRLIYEYDYVEAPNEHDFDFVSPSTTSYHVGFFRFGHSYALLDDEALWQFDNWLDDEPSIFPMTLPIIQITVDFNDDGLLPYPTAQDYSFPPPEKCGDPGTSYPSGDINKDCKVNLVDFSYFAATWLDCTEPNSVNCP
ncbi:MAG: hypothetical protein ACYS83_11645 [Planctomycetota bacterium]|jgi:hypothetical protein